VSVARSAWVIGRTGRNAVGDARMQVHVAVEGRAKAVQEGDGAEPWADCGLRHVPSVGLERIQYGCGDDVTT
jgi:hypothetical protein